MDNKNTGIVGGGHGNFHMPPPSHVPGRFMPQSPHNVPHSPHPLVQSPQIVQSPHHVVQSPHHNLASPAAQQGFGAGGNNNVFQFSDSHITMSQTEKDKALALSDQSPMAPSHASQLGGQSTVQPHLGAGGNGHSGYESIDGTVHSADAMLSAINYNNNDMLHDSTFDVSAPSLNMDDSILASNASSNRTNDSTFDLFDGDSNYHMENNQEMPLSPSCSFGLGDTNDSLSTLATVSTKQEPLGESSISVE